MVHVLDRMMQNTDEIDQTQRVPHFHIRELIRRLHWLIQIRWMFIFACLAGYILLPLTTLTNIDSRYFLGAGLFLLTNNLWHRHQTYQFDERLVETQQLRIASFLQVLGDYIALAAIVYATGSIEIPVMFLVLPNIILSALFFTKRQSLFICLMGLTVITLPLILELIGMVPVITIYDGVKQTMINDSLRILMYMGILTCCSLYCWYLVSHIAERLIKGELKLEADYWAMQRLSEAKNQATLHATHELKAPLAAIKSYVYTLRDGYAGPLPSRAQEVVQRIGQRCDRLLERISDTIRLANLKSYIANEDQLRPFDLLPPLIRKIEEAQQIGKIRNVQVILAALPGPLMVVATDEHLRTLFGNLLTNAVNYSFDNGIVEVQLKRQDDIVQLAIQDHGIGIPPDAQSKIFEDHYRAINAASHYSGGSGLGLPIALATASILGAKLSFTSEIGKGTCFTLIFKLRSFPR